jgi:hypothetical protein
MIKKKKKRKLNYMPGGTFFTSIYIVKRNSGDVRNQSTVLFRNSLRKNQSQL